jgi:hypothetical protein
MSWTRKLAWDVGFLAFGAALAGVGLLVAPPRRLTGATQVTGPARSPRDGISKDRGAR